MDLYKQIINKTNIIINGAIKRYLLVITSLIAINIFAYRCVFRYFFTGADTLTLIASSRVSSPGDVVQIFTGKLFGDYYSTNFGLGSFFRPVSTLSFSLDYSLWGLNPLGYHITDFVLHCFVVILVFFLVMMLTNGRIVASWFSAVIFAIHPIQFEVVPGIERRQDILATLFIVLALVLFIKYIKGGRAKRLILVASIISTFLALGSKETGVIIPAVVFSYIFVFQTGNAGYRNKIREAFTGSLPFIAATAAFMVYHTAVLKGLGGYDDAQGLSKIVNLEAAGFFYTYFIKLFRPVSILSEFDMFSLNPNFFYQVLSIMLLLLLLIVIIIKRKSFFSFGENIKERYLSLLKMSGVASIIGILIFPIVSTYCTNKVILSFHETGKPEFLASVMQGWKQWPVEFYLYKFRNNYLILCTTLFFASMFMIIISRKSKEIKEFLLNKTSGKTITFSLIWLVLPFLLFFVSHTFNLWYLYLSLVPASITLSLIFLETVSKIFLNKPESTFESTWQVAGYFMMSYIVAAVIVFSPLVHKYEEWDIGGTTASTFLSRLCEKVEKLPQDTTINIYGPPVNLVFDEVTYAETATFLSDYYIKSWLDLKYPDNRWQIHVQTDELVDIGEEYTFDMSHEHKNIYDINVVYGMNQSDKLAQYGN